MNNIERDRLIGSLLSEGNSLSDVQKILKNEHQLQITYMELRLISSDLDVDWQICDEKSGKSSQKNDPSNNDDKEPSDDDLSAADIDGKTIVNVSKVIRPGAVMSGDVKFKSGATAEWHLDTLGRLGLNPTKDSEKPSEDDIQEFQVELQKQLQGKM